MLPGARLKNGIENFEIDQKIDVVLARKPGHEFGLMLRYSPRKIIGDANI